MKLFLGLLVGMVCVGALQAADQKIKDFRGTAQKVALIGSFTEFVELAAEQRILQQTRKDINRYSRSYGEASVSGFTLGTNPNQKYFKPAAALDETHKKFLQNAAKENATDIIALASIRGTGDEYEMELQLYDSRIDTLSGIEKSRFELETMPSEIESLSYRVMNYLDRDGFVHPSAQDFLELPDVLKTKAGANVLKNTGKDDFSLNPADLGGGYLAGQTSVGGEKTPFWETWWFWTLLVGGVATAGGLSYYFLVYDQPPEKVNVHFTTP